MGVLAGIEPREVMQFFEALSGRHRCSRFEKDATDYIEAFATERGLVFHRDALDSIIVKKPGSAGYENAPTVILHGHIDMVCKSDEGVEHDFCRGVSLKVEGDSITADGTTLGADNGLGISYMLALLDSTDIAHPPLECVMTVMEEMGKVSGDSIDLALLSGKRMIDFNWIDENQILAGCSGDVSCRIDVDTDMQPLPPGGVALGIAIAGLRGGHCEFDIDFGRANAIVLLGRLLHQAIRAGGARIATVSGGVQNNVIPAEADATLWVEAGRVQAVEAALATLTDAIRHEFTLADPDLRITVSRADANIEQVFSEHAAARLVQTILLLPNGIQSQNLAVPGNWDTSNNIGFMRTGDTGVGITSTITSAVTSRKHAMLDQMMLLADMAGPGVRAQQIGLDAPEFPWNPDSPLLSIAKRSYERVMGRAPDVLVSVCSLELGMFTQRIDGLDTISIGTNLYDLHSPKERMDHTSAARVWPLIKDVMRHLDR